jgi:hypothetical protein
MISSSEILTSVRGLAAVALRAVRQREEAYLFVYVSNELNIWLFIVPSNYRDRQGQAKADPSRHIEKKEEIRDDTDKKLDSLDDRQPICRALVKFHYPN